MSQTARQGWPLPLEDRNPWFEDFILMVRAIDESVYAVMEDKQFILSGGGTISFTAGSGLVSWSNEIQLATATTGFTQAIPAGSVTLQDGQFLYVILTRAPQSSQILVAASTYVLTDRQDGLVLAYRINNKLYWRNGCVLADGESVEDFGSLGDLEGDVVGPARRNLVYRLSGAVMTPGIGLEEGKILEVVNGSLSTLAAISGAFGYVLRSGCDDLILVNLAAPSTQYQVLLPKGSSPGTLAFQTGVIWVGGTHLYKIDSTTREVLATYDLPGSFGYVAKMVFDGTVLWLADGDNAQIAKFDPSSAAFVVYAVSSIAHGIHDAVTYLYLAGDGEIIKFTKSNGVFASYPAPHNGSIYGLVHLASANKLAMIDIGWKRLYRWDLVSDSFDAVDLDLTLGSGQPFDAAYDGTRLLVVYYGYVDLQEVTTPTGVPALGYTSALSSSAAPPAILYDPTTAKFWVSEFDTDQLESVTPATGVVAGTIPMAGVIGYRSAASGASQLVVKQPPVTANYPAVSADHVIPVDSTGGAFWVNLLAGSPIGREFRVTDVGGECDTKFVTVNPPGGEDIAGAPWFKLAAKYASYSFLKVTATRWSVF